MVIAGILDTFKVPEGKEKRYAALLSSLLYPSIETYGAGVIAHVICNYILEGEGPSCFYSAISGMRLAQGGMPNYVMGGTIVAVNLSDYDLPFKTQAAHVGFTAVGFLVQRYIL